MLAIFKKRVRAFCTGRKTRFYLAWQQPIVLFSAWTVFSDRSLRSPLHLARRNRIMKLDHRLEEIAMLTSIVDAILLAEAQFHGSSFVRRGGCQAGSCPRVFPRVSFPLIGCTFNKTR